MLVAPPWLPVPPPAYGGTEGVVALLARGLAERGHRVRIAAVEGSHVDGTECLITPGGRPEAIGRADAEWHHLLHVLRHVRGVRPDVVIDHSGPLGALLLSGTDVPSVHVAHGRLDGAEGAAYAEVAHREASLRLIAISHSQRALAPGLPFAGVCHNGLVLREAPFRADAGDYLLFVGRMCPDKGPDAAIDIAHATGRPLILAAKCSEPAERRYFDEVIAPRLGPGIRWVGEVDTRRRFRLMAGAHALVFPIRWPEPFGMVMIEAMACGTPVLATAHGAVPEVVVDGVTGYVRDQPGDLAACVEGVASLDRRGCRRHVEEHFSHGAVAAAYEHVAMQAVDA